MLELTAFEYLCIDIASQYGMDKETFKNRIDWVKTNINKLEKLATDRGHWKEKPLYLKAVQAMRKVQRGQPIGHMVGLDASCSGMQIMSAVMDCVDGAKATGLVGGGSVPDAYTEVLQRMQKLIPGLPDSERKAIKLAVMTSLYGSVAEPKKLFGNGTLELQAFYTAMDLTAPGACYLLSELLDSWQPYELCHSWVLPDNHHVHVKVMEDMKMRPKVEELDNASFTFYYEDNVGLKKGKSNAANIVHSIDAYILRSLIRRCSYNKKSMKKFFDIIVDEALCRNLSKDWVAQEPSEELQSMIDRYEVSGIADTSILPLLDSDSISSISIDLLEDLGALVQDILQYPSFSIITGHDEFKCHANHMNRLRYHYRNILADLADSHVINDILNQVTGSNRITGPRRSTLGPMIRKAVYPLS